MIFVLVEKAVVHYQPDLKATRNPASKRSCACSLVAQALTKHGHRIGERQVKRIYRGQAQGSRADSRGVETGVAADTVAHLKIFSLVHDSLPDVC